MISSSWRAAFLVVGSEIGCTKVVVLGWAGAFLFDGMVLGWVMGWDGMYYELRIRYHIRLSLDITL